ncbi:MAG: hypothetical protein U0T84_06095 [Chitinophagales bacterium]
MKKYILPIALFALSFLLGTIGAFLKIEQISDPSGLFVACIGLRLLAVVLAVYIYVRNRRAPVRG